MDYKFNSKKLIDKYANMISRIAIKYLDCTDDVEDIVQDVFLKYIGYIKTGNYFNSEEHEKCWIIRVTMNLCCNAVNTAKIKKTLPLNECFYMEVKITNENILIEAMRKLEDKYRIVFEMFYLDGFTVNEISKILEISDANVKTRLKRARIKIRELVRREKKAYGRI